MTEPCTWLTEDAGGGGAVGVGGTGVAVGGGVPVAVAVDVAVAVAVAVAVGVAGTQLIVTLSGPTLPGWSPLTVTTVVVLQLAMRVKVTVRSSGVPSVSRPEVET